MKRSITIGLLVSFLGLAAAADIDSEVARLSREVSAKGWIVFPALSDKGDWDLFLMRPDGSHRRAITSTPEWNETAPQFSRDGKRLLYRRLKLGEKVEGNRYGEQGVPVVANSDGTEARVLGAEGDLPWASWSADGRQLATLSLKGVAVIETDTGRAVRSFPRRGLFQQLTWAPDGKSMVGVANSFGTGWSIARMDALNGEVTPINKVDCCTPDWFPDSAQVIFSWRPPNQKGNRGQGWTQLWRADAGGKSRALVYGEDGRHVYGGHVSPDGRYVLFTGNVEEDGDPRHAGSPMALMRLADGPIIGGDSSELRALHPGAHRGPVLPLPPGWEPCWTFDESAAGAAASITTRKP